MKKVLIVSSCVKRRNTIGLIGELLSVLKGIDHSKYHLSLFDTNFFEKNHKREDYEVDSYHTLDKNWADGIMRRIPYFRTNYENKIIIKTYTRLIDEHKYDVIIVYQIPSYADSLVAIAHSNGAKIVFEPLGSDILRVSDATKSRLIKAFSEVDGVCGYDKSGTLIAAKDIYNVPDCKIFKQIAYVKGVKILMDLRGKLSRHEMTGSIGLPFSMYNIVCGYSGRESHRHKMIIESLIRVKDYLPEDYLIIFPMTYGAGPHHERIIKYASQLKKVCDEAGLKTAFLTSFMTEVQVAYLHLVTDLFIEIQPTDNGNGFMVEALYAENQIVTGRWLNYERFEQFGIPYHLIDTPEDLPGMLKRIFTGEEGNIRVPQALLEHFKIPDGYNQSSFWEKLFDNLSIIAFL